MAFYLLHNYMDFILHYSMYLHVIKKGADYMRNIIFIFHLYSCSKIQETIWKKKRFAMSLIY